MITALTTLFTLITSGAGGGIVGGLFGIFKQSQERRERVAMAEIDLKRDVMEFKNAEAERAHALTMLEKGAEIKLATVQTEAEAEIEISNQQALGAAQDALKNLKTSTGMDNYRGSVRPTLAYWASALFTVMLAWAFVEFRDTIEQEHGRQILTGMFGTLTFLVTSIGAFYFVSRRNSAPRL